jgi:replicative DNA helicase
MTRASNDSDFDSALPPHSPEAERGVLGCVMLGGRETLAEALDVIRSPEEFYELTHRRLWEEFLAMDDANVPIESNALISRLLLAKAMDEVGGLAYLCEHESQVPSAANIAYYTETVHLQWRLRRMQAAIAQAAARIPNTAPGTENATLDDIEAKIIEANTEQDNAAMLSMATLVEAEIDRVETAFEHRNQGLESGINTGFSYWHKKAGGLQPGNLYLIGGRPSTGKTSLAVSMILNVAVRRQLPVGFLSLEMTRSEITLRMLCNEGRASMKRVHSGMITEGDKRGLEKAVAPVAHAPIFIDDTPALTPAGLRQRGRRLVSRYGAKMLVIDHLHEIIDPAHRGDEQKDAKAAVTSAKWLAKVMGVPVVALAQLNREFEKEKARRSPRMSDLRGHGANEQVADFIGILYRDYDREKQADQDYDENADVWLNTLEICKQRNGPTGPVWFRFDRPTMRYEDETMNTGNKADGDRRRAETTAGGEL